MIAGDRVRVRADARRQRGYTGRIESIMSRKKGGPPVARRIFWVILDRAPNECHAFYEAELEFLPSQPEAP